MTESEHNSYFLSLDLHPIAVDAVVGNNDAALIGQELYNIVLNSILLPDEPEETEETDIWKLNPVTMLRRLVHDAYESELKAYLRAVALSTYGVENEFEVSTRYATVKKFAQKRLDHRASVVKANEKFYANIDRMARLKKMNSTHAAGTTAEIAALLGITKAKVRQLKTTGMLESAIAAHNLGKIDAV